MDIIDRPLPELIAEADAARKKYIGPDLELCSIINAKSGLCKEDCGFCAQSSHNRSCAPRYSLKDKEEIIGAASKAKEIGARKFGIVTSGNRLTSKELDVIASAIHDIKKNVGIEPCASLGALTREELSGLKASGLTRYHHNIETSPRFYPKVVSTHTFDERLKTIAAAKEAGLEVCSGGIIGMGETWQDRVDMAGLLKSLEVDAVPINILVPIDGTRMESIEPISCGDAVKTISIFRITLKDKTIKIAAGRESALGDFQGMGFMAGANGMLIGGYLTVKGRSVESDHRLIKEIKRLWEE
jgi:biotin synthase